MNKERVRQGRRKMLPNLLNHL